MKHLYLIKKYKKPDIFCEKCNNVKRQSVIKGLKI